MGVAERAWHCSHGCSEQETLIYPAGFTKVFMAEHLTVCPTLKQLNKLKKSIAFKWHDLGIELLEPEDIRTLDEIQSNYPRDASTCCTKMFQLWLDKQPEASWEQLIESLRVIDLNEVANTTKQQLNESELFISGTAWVTMVG